MQRLHDQRRGFNTHIRHQQAGFELFEQLVVDILFTQEQIGHAVAQIDTGLGQALLHPRKKAFGLFGLGILRRGRLRRAEASKQRFGRVPGGLVMADRRFGGIFLLATPPSKQALFLWLGLFLFFFGCFGVFWLVFGTKH